MNGKRSASPNGGRNDGAIEGDLPVAIDAADPRASDDGDRLRADSVAWRDAQTRLMHPAFDAIRASLQQLPADAWPSLSQLNRCLGGARNHRGMALQCVAPEAGAAPDRHYELRIAECGEIATRPNWHDLFNALAWTAFPRTKSAISAMHARIIAEEGAAELQRRGVARDVLTLFDESGAIVVSESPDTLATLRNFQWKALFWERRADWRRDAQVFVFGHALMEQMLAPHVGVTAKCLLLEVPRGWLSAGDAAARIGEIDRRTAEYFLDAAHLASTRSLQPLPLLGVPGWDVRAEEEAFYDDVRYFRPGYSRPPRVQ